MATSTTGPTPNKFMAFSTMTYSVSLFIISPERYSKMINEGIKDVSGLSLILQSGGIDDLSSRGNAGAHRSQYFKNDFYIDDVQLTSAISGTSVGAPHNAIEVNFTITEPMGLTFMGNLHAANQAYYKALGEDPADMNFVSQTYLMVIRFYGYDEDGNQISGGDLETSDNRAFAEKWIPFMFKSITFKLHADKVVYTCEGVSTPSQIGFGRIHSSIPFNIALQGQTIGDLFNSSNSQGKVVSHGLANALNVYHSKLKTSGKYKVSDVYEFEFTSDLIKNAVLADPAGPDSVVAIDRTGNSTVSERELLSKSAKVLGNKTYSLTAGMTIYQVLDLAIRTSSYITGQFDTNTGKRKDPTKMLWFKINPKIEILEYDNIRHSWAHKIKYVISEYEIKSIQSADAPEGSCDFAVHKEYDFWFTGKNTEVLNFSQDYNFMYYTTFSQHANSGNLPQNNLRAMQVHQQQSGEASIGSTSSAADEQAANIANILYSPADQAMVAVDIVGDPDWIAQSELFYRPTGDKSRTFKDGSINYDSSEVFFAINFNTVVDYSLDTGLADVTQNNVAIDPTANTGTVSQYSLVYRANMLTTQLSKGRFTQRLEGSIVWMPPGCLGQVNTRADSAKLKDNALDNQSPRGSSTPSVTGKPESNNLVTAASASATNLPTGGTGSTEYSYYGGPGTYASEQIGNSLTETSKTAEEVARGNTVANKVFNSPFNSL